MPNVPPTLLDKFYRASFRNERLPGWTNNAVWRDKFINARRFVLDDDMSTFLGQLAADAFKPGTSTALIRRRIEELRLCARLPHDITWVEYNLRKSMARSQGILGLPFNPDGAPEREGWLLMKHPTIDTAFIAHILTHDPALPDWNGDDCWTFPVAYAWTVDQDTVLPWRSLPFDTAPENAATCSEAATGVLGYKTDRASVVFSDMIKTPTREGPWLANLVKEWAGCMRRMWALLATINDLPVRVADVRQTKGFIARSQYRHYLDHKTITLTVPQDAYRKVARDVLAIAHRRAHDVRGHWRADYRNPLSPLCEHDFTADDKHLICKRCKGRKSWIPPHQRGDASRGFVTHDYQVKRGDHE